MESFDFAVAYAAETLVFFFNADRGQAFAVFEGGYTDFLNIFRDRYLFQIAAHQKRRSSDIL